MLLRHFLSFITAFICIFIPVNIAKSESLLTLNFPTPPPSSNTNNNSGTAGGGTRGSSGITIIIPQNNTVETTSENPSLFVWYDANSQIKELEIVLELGQEQERVIRISDLPSQNSILEIKFPEDITLKPDYSYKWTVRGIVSELDPTANSSIEGTIKIVTLTSDQREKIQQAKAPLEKAEIYAQFYLWNETLTTVLQLRDTQSQQWQELLQSVELELPEEINTAPIVTISGE